jgi:uncharacterized protein with GYD domain
LDDARQTDIYPKRSLPEHVSQLAKALLAGAQGEKTDPAAAWVVGRSIIGVQYHPGGMVMPTYIALLNWTPQGLQNIKQSPSRLDTVRKGFQSVGVTIKDFYMVTGQFDMILMCEAPDDNTLARAILSAAAQGNVKTETCRAFTEQEYRQIIAGLS